MDIETAKDPERWITRFSRETERRVFFYATIVAVLLHGLSRIFGN
jgi:hypothetical protein